MNAKLTRIGGMFLLLLLVLIFLSKTIYSYNIPVVTAGDIKSGRLKKEEIVSGVAHYNRIIETYFEFSGHVDEIFVKEGDRVKKGDPLIRFRFNDEDLEKNRVQLEMNRRSIALDIENTYMEINKYERFIQNLKNEAFDIDEISLFDLEQLKNKLDKEEGEFDSLQTLYEAGAVSSSEFNKAQFDLNELRATYEEKKREIEKQKEDNQKSYEDKLKDRDKKIEDYNYEIQRLNQSLKAKQIELEKLDIESRRLDTESSRLSDNKIIYAEEDGTVLKIPVKLGQYISQNQLVASIGSGNEFTISLNIDLKNNFIALGDEGIVYNSNMRTTGKVTNIQLEEEHKQVSVLIESDSISQGETVDVIFSKESANVSTLVPNSAINKDSDGHFVYFINKRAGILGEEYYLVKNTVTIGDSDHANTEILGVINFFNPVVVFSDRQIGNGTTVRLKNEGDYFGS